MSFFNKELFRALEVNKMISEDKNYVELPNAFFSIIV